jgi:hypothetical protein
MTEPGSGRDDPFQSFTHDQTLSMMYHHVNIDCIVNI